MVEPPGNGWLAYLVAIAAAGIGWLAKSLMPAWQRRNESALAREMREQEAEEKERGRLQAAAEKASGEHVAVLKAQNQAQQAEMTEMRNEMRTIRGLHHECEARVGSQAVVIGQQSGKISVLEAQASSMNSRISSLTSAIEKMRVRDTVIPGLRDS